MLKFSSSLWAEGIIKRRLKIPYRMKQSSAGFFCSLEGEVDLKVSSSIQRYSTKQEYMIIKCLSMYFFLCLVIAITVLQTWKFLHNKEVQMRGSCQIICALEKYLYQGPC